jgi:hypothetical protein
MDMNTRLRNRGRIRRLEARVEAHVFIAFLAYCLHVHAGAASARAGAGLRPRRVLEKLAAV